MSLTLFKEEEENVSLLVQSLLSQRGNKGPGQVGGGGGGEGSEALHGPVGRSDIFLRGDKFKGKNALK